MLIQTMPAVWRKPGAIARTRTDYFGEFSGPCKLTGCGDFFNARAAFFTFFTLRPWNCYARTEKKVGFVIILGEREGYFCALCGARE
jgi:hypothetical protein